MQTSPQPTFQDDKSDRAEANRISVVIPVYNGAAYLRATLDSVMAQSCPPGEIIVVDDGSTDDSVEIARSYGVTVISQSNKGLSAARNAGSYAAHGEYIAYLDADDIWSEKKLELQYRAIRAYGGAAFSFTDYRMFDENGVDERYGVHTHPAFRKVTGKRGREAHVRIEANQRRPVLADDYILPSTTLIRRADFIAIGGFDESLRISEDHEFFLRLFRIVPAIAVMQPLVLYRRHPAQISAKPIALVAAFFEIERRVAAAPQRYPQGDVRYFACMAFLAHRRIAVLQARLGRFAEARESFKSSLAARPTIPAIFGVIASSIGGTRGGHVLFIAGRALLRRIRARRKK